MTRFIKGAAIAAAMTIGGTAMGQTGPDYTPVNVSLRAGAGFPLDNSMQNISDVWFAAGLDWRLDSSWFPGGETYFSFDWFGRSSQGANGNVFPICVNQKWFSGANDEGTNRSYFFLGAGAFIVDIGQSDTVFGGRGGVGVELGPHFFAEAAAYISTKANNAFFANFAGVYLGYRF